MFWHQVRCYWVPRRFPIFFWRSSWGLHCGKLRRAANHFTGILKRFPIFFWRSSWGFHCGKLQRAANHFRWNSSRFPIFFWRSIWGFHCGKRRWAANHFTWVPKRFPIFFRRSSWGFHCGKLRRAGNHFVWSLSGRYFNSWMIHSRSNWLHRSHYFRIFRCLRPRQCFKHISWKSCRWGHFNRILAWNRRSHRCWWRPVHMRRCRLETKKMLDMLLASFASTNFHIKKTNKKTNISDRTVVFNLFCSIARLQKLFFKIAPPPPMVLLLAKNIILIWYYFNANEIKG